MEKRKVWVSRLDFTAIFISSILSVFLLFISFGYTISISNSLSFFERIINFDITPTTSQAIILLQATPITPGQTITDSTSTTRMYSLTITQRSSVTIILEMNPLSGNYVDYDLYVNWDGTLPNQTSYHCRPYKSGVATEQCENTLDPGTYYIMVKYYSGVGNYKLTVNVNPSTPPPPTPPTPPTPPPTPPSTSVTPITPGQTITDSTSTTRMYSLTITQRSSVTITLEMNPLAGNYVDYDLYVNWDGTLPNQTSYHCRPNRRGGETEQCSNNTVDPGTYYIMVKYYTGAGNYKLTVNVNPSTPPPPPPPPPPSPLPDTPITPGRTITGTTDTTRMYSLTITQRSFVTITLEMGTTVDYDLYVKWDGTKPIKSSWDCRPYYDEGMTEQCSNTVNAGTYYFMVKHYKGQGTYKLTVTTAPPQ
ncbi:MAG: PPC domain-containing protein [Candidatus Aenigmatarchaeota archaeon]